MSIANSRLDWDTYKDAENHQKHGVSCSRAQDAFADTHSRDCQGHHT
ncbi:MAG: BrnT family toxin [Rhodocyclales bacterium]|nr:BrnT family toxin [Rhodocyclales bacterium]MBH1976093.1 BrnT family toxin [Rhodocyclales bacterium]